MSSIPPSTPDPMIARDALAGRDDLEQRLNLAVQRNGNRTVLFTNAIAQHIGLSATEFECYSLLMEGGPLTAGQLGAACGLSSGGVTGLIKRLKDGGFVSSQRDPKDRRRVIVSALYNQAALQMLETLYAPVGRAFTEVMSHYSDAELRVVIDFLDRGDVMIAGILEAMRADDSRKQTG